MFGCNTNSLRSSPPLQKKVFKITMRINFLNKIADNSTRSEELLIQTPGLQQGEPSYQTLIVADNAFFNDVIHRARFWGWESLHYDSLIAFICNAKSIIRIVFLIWHCRLHSSFDTRKKSILLDLHHSAEPVLNFPSRAHWWKQDAIVGSAFCTNPDLHIS